MPATYDTQQTQTFRSPEQARSGYGSDQPVHVLLLLDDNARPRRIPLHSLPVMIGRNPPADLILEGPTVSRRHCRLDLLDGRLQLADLASTNGTFVNGEPITRPVLLEDGAILGIGVYRLRYHRRAQDETAEADAMEQEWREATQYVASILPQPIEQGPVLSQRFISQALASAATRSATKCRTNAISRCSCWMFGPRHGGRDARDRCCAGAAGTGLARCRLPRSGSRDQRSQCPISDAPE